MKALTKFLDFAVSQDWRNPGPTALAGGALVASIGVLVALWDGLSDGWKALCIFIGSLALCFLGIPRVMAGRNAEREREADEARREQERRTAEDAKWEAKNEAFYALAPEIASLIQMAESALDSRLLKEDGEERHDAYQLLLRLKGEFAIDVPPEPTLLAMTEVSLHLQEVAKMAYAKDLRSAQKLKSPW